MAEEMRDSRFASFQPIIVMGRTLAYGVIKDATQIAEQTTIEDRTWLYNVGTGPALNLRFLLKEPSRKNPSGTATGKELRALAPGEGYELMIENVFGQKMLRSHDLVVEYEDVFGRKWCSGLELNYSSGADRFTVIKLFYEKVNEQSGSEASTSIRKATECQPPLQEKSHEEKLLAQRLTLFLLANSILFLGFVGLWNSVLRNTALKFVVPSIGIVCCIVLILNAFRVKGELNSLGKKLGIELPHGKLKIFAGRYIGFWMAALFLLIWGFSLYAVWQL